MVAFNNSDWMSLCVNLRKSQRQWEVVVKVMKKKGETVLSHAMMYNAVVQTMILYMSESWVVAEAMLKML